MEVGLCHVWYLQIDKNLKSLERCQSLEEIQRLYEAGDYTAVVHLLRPTLCFSGRVKHLEFVTSIPERPAQLLLLQVCWWFTAILNPKLWKSYLAYEWFHGVVYLSCMNDKLLVDRSSITAASVVHIILKMCTDHLSCGWSSQVFCLGKNNHKKDWRCFSWNEPNLTASLQSHLPELEYKEAGGCCCSTGLVVAVLTFME